jgi:hypothetical protein
MHARRGSPSDYKYDFSVEFTLNGTAEPPLYQHVRPLKYMILYSKVHGSVRLTWIGIQYAGFSIRQVCMLMSFNK